MCFNCESLFDTVAIDLFIMKVESNIIVFVKYTNIIFNIVGLKRIETRRNELQVVGKRYKMYSTVLLLSVIFWYIYFAIINIRKIYKFNFSVAITFLVNQISIVITLWIILIYNAAFNIKKTLKIYRILIDIYEIIEFPSERNKSIKRTITIFFLTWITFRIAQWTISSLIWPKHNTIASNISIFIIDFSLVRFIFEINIIARRFEYLNRYLIHKHEIENDLQIFYVQDSIITRFWRMKDLSKVKINLSHEKILSIHNKLIEIVSMITTCYDTLVNFHKYYNFQ